MSSHARNTHMNLSAPLDERRDARAEMERTYYPTTSDFPPLSDVKLLVDECSQAFDEQGFAKSAVPGSATSAFGLTRPSDRSPRAAGSVMVADQGGFGSVGYGGYRARASIFQPEQLRMMVEHTPLLNAIIGRRERTVMRFLRPAERDRDVGFEVRRKDDERPLRTNDDAEETRLTQFVLSSGDTSDPIARKRLERDTLTEFMKKSIRDLLTLDAWAIETVRTRNRRDLSGYYGLDAGTIYLASEHGYQGDDSVVAVQLINGMAVTTYTPDDLVYVCQNPRTDLLHHGYGYPPTEMIVRVVTGYLNAMTYNLQGFSNNSIPKGILTLFGSYDARQLTAFKQQWNAMITGVNNAWKLPVLQSDSKESAAHFEKLGVEFSDMYFAKWMTLLVSIVCAIYGMDPTEVYSEAFHAGKSSLSGSDRAEALADARDTGLEPLMAFIENTFTDHILARINHDYKFRFFGLQPVDRAWRQEVMKLTNTVNEARLAEGLDPLSDELLGNAPLNNSLIGLYMQRWQGEQQAQQQAMGTGDETQPGQPGQGEAEGEDADEGQGPDLMESGDRNGAPAQDPPPEVSESGDRNQEGQVDQAAGFQNSPEQSKRDRWFGPSSMKKSRVISRQDLVIVG